MLTGVEQAPTRHQGVLTGEVKVAATLVVVLTGTALPANQQLQAQVRECSGDQQPQPVVCHGAAPQQHRQMVSCPACETIYSGGNNRMIS